MKLQLAIATVLATEALSDSPFPVPAKTTTSVLLSSETAMNRIKMIEAVSELKSGDGNHKKNRPPQTILWKWQQSLDSAIKEQRGSNNSSSKGGGEADAETLDLGILGSVSTHEQGDGRDHRRLQVFDFCDLTMEEIKAEVSEFASKPFAINTETFCEAVTENFGPEVCNECGSTELETGEYSLKIDCPGLIGVTKCDICVDRLQTLCEEEETCPGCGPMCKTCGTNNGDDWFIDNQNCMMTYEMRVANEIEKGTPVDTEEAADFLLYDQGMLEMYLNRCDGDTLVSVDLEDEGSLDEGTDEGTEEKDAAGVASSRGLHSPMSTILRFALVGASWFWMAT